MVICYLYAVINAICSQKIMHYLIENDSKLLYIFFSIELFEVLFGSLLV